MTKKRENTGVKIGIISQKKKKENRCRKGAEYLSESPQIYAVSLQKRHPIIIPDTTEVKNPWEIRYFVS